MRTPTHCRFYFAVVTAAWVAVGSTPIGELHSQSRLSARVGLSVPPTPPTLVESRRWFTNVSRSERSYWLEGGLLTGVGLLAATLPWLLDGDGSAPLKILRGGLFVGAGFAPGALIGGQIPKRRKEDPASSTADAGGP